MRFATITSALVLCGLAAAPFGGAMAGEDNWAGVGMYEARAKPTVANCPGVDWHIQQQPGGKLTGVVFFRDMSGVSNAVGQGDPKTGQFTLTLTSVSGKGPVGTVTGSRTSKGLVAEMKGDGCNNIKVNMPFQRATEGSRG